MARIVFVLSLIFFEGIIFGSCWFESSMVHLYRRTYDSGESHRLRRDLCDELIRHRPHGDAHWNRDIARIQKKGNVYQAFLDVGYLIDELDVRSPGIGEEILRRIMRKWNMQPEPMKYRLLSERLTLSEANVSCIRNGGKLAVIRTGVEQTLAWRAAEGAHTNKVFIGLRRSSGGCQWADGTPFGFINLKSWPNRYGNYGVLIVGTGKWDLDSCWKKLQALCEFQMKPTAAPPKTTTSPYSPIRRTTTSQPPYSQTAGPKTTTSPYSPIRRTTTSQPPYSQTAGPKTTRRPYRPLPVTNAWTPSTRPRTTQRKQRITTKSPFVAHEKITSKPSSSNPLLQTPWKYLETEIRLNVEFSVAISTRDFNSTLIKSIAQLLSKKETHITIINMRPGSTIVRLKVWLSGGETPDRLRHMLQAATKDGEFLDAKFQHLRGMPEKQIDPVDESQGNHMKIFIPIIIVLSLVIVIMVGIGLLFFMTKRKRQVSHTQEPPPARAAAYEEQPPPYIEFQASAQDYTQPPQLDASAPPKYDECMDTKKEVHV